MEERPAYVAILIYVCVCNNMSVLSEGSFVCSNMANCSLAALSNVPNAKYLAHLAH